MQQYARVIEVDSERELATVEIGRHGSCDNCGDCKEEGGSNDLQVEAKNPIGAKSGDMVAIKMEDRNVLGALFMVYFLPLINMFIGYFLGKWLLGRLGVANSDLAGAFIAVIFLASSFLLAKRYGEKGKLEGKYQPTIKRTVDPTVEDISQNDHHHHH